MSISKLLKSNNLIFFVIALILMGFAVHSLGKRKNNIVDSLVGHHDLNPYELDDDSMLADSNISSGQLMDETEYTSEGSAPVMQRPLPRMPIRAPKRKTVASVSPNVPSGVTDPKDLLPNNKNNSFSNRDLINAGRFISQQDEVLRNANLQIRSDPPVGKSDTGPWNQTTITPDTMRPQFELGTSGGSSNVSGFRKNCPMWMSSKVENSNAAILPPSYKAASSQ